MTIRDLDAEIREIEGQLAPGSQTWLLDDFATRMEALKDAAGGDTEISHDECEWWRNAYAYLAQHPRADLDEINAHVTEDAIDVDADDPDKPSQEDITAFLL